MEKLDADEVRAVQLLIKKGLEERFRSLTPRVLRDGLGWLDRSLERAEGDVVKKIKELLKEPGGSELIVESAVRPFRQAVWRSIHHRQEEDRQAAEAIGYTWPEEEWPTVPKPPEEGAEAGLGLRSIWDRLLDEG